MCLTCKMVVFNLAAPLGCLARESFSFPSPVPCLEERNFRGQGCHAREGGNGKHRGGKGRVMSYCDIGYTK